MRTNCEVMETLIIFYLLGIGFTAGCLFVTVSRFYNEECSTWWFWVFCSAVITMIWLPLLVRSIIKKLRR